MGGHTESPHTTGRCHVNRRLLPVKGFFFFVVAGRGMVAPYLTLFLKHLNLTPSETGILNGFMTFATFFVRPALGVIADKLQLHKLILVLCTLGAAVSCMILLILPPRQPLQAVVHTQLLCSEGGSYFRDCRSPSYNGSDYSTPCVSGLSELVDSMPTANVSGNTNEDCSVRCSENDDFRGRNGSMVFLDAEKHFKINGTETIINEMPVSFKILNFSRAFEKSSYLDWNSSKVTHCIYHGLTSLQFGDSGKQYDQLSCNEEFSFRCEVVCSNPSPGLCWTWSGHEFDSTFGWAFLVCFVVVQTVAPLLSTAYAIALTMLSKEKHRLGEQRMWGSLGFLIVVIASTIITYVLNEGGDVNFALNFGLSAALFCSAALTASRINYSNVKCGNIFHNSLTMMRTRQSQVFAVIVIFSGLLNGTVEGFLFWYLDDLGAGQLLYGVILFMDNAFEILMMAVSPFLIGRLGAVPCVYLSLLAFALQFGGYALLGNPWLALVIEPLQGITHLLLSVSLCIIGDQLAPPGMSATMQALISSFYVGIGTGLGNLLTGLLFGELGGGLTFLIYAVATIPVLLLYIAINHLVFKAHSDHNTSLSVDSPATPDLTEPTIRTPLLAERDGVTPNRIDLTESTLQSQHCLPREMTSHEQRRPYRADTAC